MFTCTQCAQCIAACNTVQAKLPDGSLLDWVDKTEARANEARMSLTGKR
jgi:Fe-S-cluster-containing dehydrogenase component